MRIPHPPAGLTPAQIAAYTLAFLTLASITVTVGVLIKPLGIILLVLFSIALICALAYFGLALYNDHADRTTQRQRIKIGEIVMLERDGVQIIVDPQRAASPALAISAAGVTPLLAVDQAQQARNIQAAAVQLAQAAPHAGGRFAEMIHERTPPAQILTPVHPVPQLKAPTMDLATITVDLISRLSLDAGAENVLLGVDATGAEVRGTLHDLMHTGLLAATGGGKTTTLSSLALQLAHDPAVQLVIADPHLMELALLEDTGALRYGLPGNGKQAVQVLTELANEVHRRAELVNQVSQQIKELEGRRQVLHRLDRYNRAARHVGAEHLPTLVCFGDEIRALAGLGPEAEKALGTITSEGRKFGVYFVGASQSWKSSVIDSDVRGMFWSRYALAGATVRQTAELFEIDQAEARALTVQLTAPGVAALWRRGAGTTVLKTPYVNLESDRAYTLIEVIAANRARHDRHLPPPIPGENVGENLGEIFTSENQQENVFSPSERDFSPLPDFHQNAENSTIDVQKRDRVAEMVKMKKGKVAILGEVWGVTGGKAYQAAAREYDAILAVLNANERTILL
jgi:hypothetical protein